MLVVSHVNHVQLLSAVVVLLLYFAAVVSSSAMYVCAHVHK